MLSRRNLLLLALAALVVTSSVPAAMAARYYRRQYYSSWSYYPTATYYYSYYRYQPYGSTDYHNHYCVYYPSRPRYVYYYNPYTSVYWGRYDLEEKGYSMLEEKDRKKELSAIDEKAFPKPGAMPVIPESEKDPEKVQIEKPNIADLPKAEAPKDLPAK